MSFAIGLAGSVKAEGALPQGWRKSSTVEASMEVLSLEGPTWVGERRPRLIVSVQSAETTAIGAESAASGAAHVQWACRARWPHREWGEGMLHQGVRIEGDVALAHDVYLFHDGRTGIRVELECELQSLFAVEEDVARILDVLSSGECR